MANPGQHSKKKNAAASTLPRHLLPEGAAGLMRHDVIGFYHISVRGDRNTRPRGGKLPELGGSGETQDFQPVGPGPQDSGIKLPCHPRLDGVPARTKGL